MMVIVSLAALALAAAMETPSQAKRTLVACRLHEQSPPAQAAYPEGRVLGFYARGQFPHLDLNGVEKIVDPTRIISAPKVAQIVTSSGKEDGKRVLFLLTSPPQNMLMIRETPTGRYEGLIKLITGGNEQIFYGGCAIRDVPEGEALDTPLSEKDKK